MLVRGFLTVIASAALVVSTVSLPAVAGETGDELTVDPSIGQSEEVRTIDEPEWRDDAEPEVVPEPEELTEEQAQYEAHLRLQAEKIMASDAEAMLFDESEAPESSADGTDSSSEPVVPESTDQPTPSEQPEAPATPEPTVEPTPTDEPVPSEAPVPSELPADTVEGDEASASPAGLLRTASGGSFSAGNIITNENFYNGSAMSESQIQSFLQKQVGSCKNSNCLANYKANTPNRSWSWGNCAAYQGARNESAARIIYKVQRACNLSAKVILVTLQKEQSLLTNKAPTAGVMRKAMGYGCPDTDVCDSTYYGFFNQVFAAGRQLTWYGDPNGSFTWIKVGQVNSIRYHPSASCGSGNVRVQNRATSALYYYTPYQPNSAALSNMYGTGNSCSAYGNRNFWRMYRDWFGDPSSNAPSVPTMRLSGSDRYGTAAAVSKNAFPKAGVPVAYIASGEDYADALSAAPAAATQGGPLLLTKRGKLPSETSAELKRLKPKRIVIVGGSGVVNGSVSSALSRIAPVKRLGGSDRYATSRLVADYAFSNPRVVYLATGFGFADALSAGAPAGAIDSPVVLVKGTRSSIDSATRSAIARAGVNQVRIAGGSGAVSSGIERSLKSQYTVKRYHGSDRYSTSAALVKWAFGAGEPAYVAAGNNYPDALAAAAAAGHQSVPLVLSKPKCMPGATSGALEYLKVSQLRLLGGAAVLSGRVGEFRAC